MKILAFLIIFQCVVPNADAFFFRRELTDEEKVEKLWEQSRTKWREIFDTSKNPNEHIFSQMLVDYVDSYQDKFEPVTSLHDKTYQPAEKNEWLEIANLNREAGLAWGQVLRCVQYSSATDKNAAMIRAKTIYGQNQLCQEADTAVRAIRMQLKNFLFTTNVLVPSRSFPELKGEEWFAIPLYKGGIQFHPFFMQLILEEMTLGFRPYDIGYCFLGTLTKTNCQGYNFDIKHWTDAYTHKNGGYWQKIQGPENFRKRQFSHPGFDKLDRSDPEMAQLLASLNAISVFNLLRRSSEHSCAQWGLWPNYTYMVASGVAILSNLHGIFTDTLVPEQRIISQDCRLDPARMTNSSGVSWGALMMLNLEMWKNFTQFQQGALPPKRSR